MNVDLLSSIGLGNIDFSFVILGLILVLLIVIIILIIQMVSLSKLKKKYKKFMTGKAVKSLEDEIISIISNQKEILDMIDNNKADIRTLFKKHETAFQKLSLVKYDAFNQMGGQLSYCIALLDENNNGYILNSVHSAESCYSYAKEIVDGKCDISLGKEEEEALEQAMTK